MLTKGRKRSSATSIDVDKVATAAGRLGRDQMAGQPDQNPGFKITFGEVVLSCLDSGHVRHNHPTSEEILYVLSGVGEQMVDDAPCSSCVQRYDLHPHRHISLDGQ